ILSPSLGRRQCFRLIRSSTRAGAFRVDGEKESVIHTSFFGSKNRSNFFTEADFLTRRPPPRSVDRTQITSSSDCTLVQSKRRRLARRSRQSANFCVSSSDMRLTQPCSHSISFPANERPHFQQVF